MFQTARPFLPLAAVGAFLLPAVGQTPDAPSGTRTPMPVASSAAPSAEESQDNDKPLPASRVRNPILWQQPENISARNLLYGQGGEKHQPKPPFVFDAEDPSGTNPKFDVRDADGKKWRVKVGEEARPEVVASRLLWAVGYFANEDYLLPAADIQNLKIKRGSGSIKGEHVTYARFSRKPGGQNKIATWEWKENPFSGTEEFDGLRVMMAVMNNWDLKDVNNAVFYDKNNNRQIFLVSDMGATFGTNGLSFTRARSKGNIGSFKSSKFIEKKTDTTVSFATPKAPTALLLETAGTGLPGYIGRSGYTWIGNNIPLEHARWIGKLLGQLSREQVSDAFRAGNFPPEEIPVYADLVYNRILQLGEL